MNIMYIGMNNTYPPFDKVEVRQAIAMGIDRAPHHQKLLPGRFNGR